MKIAVASGKGGTGKTTVSLALAYSAVQTVTLIDCDVEEPNCQLFARGELLSRQAVTVPIPGFTVKSCSGCGICVQKCRFHALARLGNRVLVFPELCHSCGNCVMSCPDHVLSEKPFEIGAIEYRQLEQFDLYTGVLKIGHPMAPPLIRALKKLPVKSELTIFDAPPGTACPMVTTVENCDFALLVTEPTPFGLHDLELAVQTLRTMHIPLGLILNRATGGDGDRAVEKFAAQNHLPLLLKIPFSRTAAAHYSQGKFLLTALPELRERFAQLPEQIKELLA